MIIDSRPQASHLWSLITWAKTASLTSMAGQGLALVTFKAQITITATIFMMTTHGDGNRNLSLLLFLAQNEDIECSPIAKSFLVHLHHMQIKSNHHMVTGKQYVSHATKSNISPWKLRRVQFITYPSLPLTPQPSTHSQPQTNKRIMEMSNQHILQDEKSVILMVHAAPKTRNILATLVGNEVCYDKVKKYFTSLSLHHFELLRITILCQWACHSGVT